jgi:hypothetical protein
VTLQVTTTFTITPSGTLWRDFQKLTPALGGPAKVSGTNYAPNQDIVEVQVQVPPAIQYATTLFMGGTTTAEKAACSAQGNWFDVAPPNNVSSTGVVTPPSVGTELVITYYPAVLQAMDLTGVTTSATAPKCVGSITFSAPVNGSTNVPNVILTVEMDFNSELVTNVTPPGGSPTLQQYATPPTYVGGTRSAATTTPIVFDFASNNSQAVAQIVSFQGDSLPLGLSWTGYPAVTTNFGSGCTVGATISPLAVGTPAYIAPDTNGQGLIGGGTAPQPQVSFSVTVNPTGCNNNVQLSGATGALITFIPSNAGIGTTASTAWGNLTIPIVANIGNVMQVTTAGTDKFTGPSGVGTTNAGTNSASDDVGYNQTGYSIASDNSTNGAPTSAYTLTVANTNPANSPFAFKLNVWTLAGFSVSGTPADNATCSAGAGAATASSAVPVSVAAPGPATAGWFVATANQATAGAVGGAAGDTAATVTFSVNQNAWNSLPATTDGCVYTGVIDISTTAAAGSPSSTYSVSFTKINQPVVTSAFSPYLSNGTIAFGGVVGQGLVAPEIFTVVTPMPPFGENTGFTVDARTDAIAGTSYPGYGYPPDGLTNLFAFDYQNATGANVQSWLTANVVGTTPVVNYSVTGGTFGVQINANTANLTPSPTQAVPNAGAGPCPAGTILVTTLSPQACATPYTGRIRLRSGVNETDSYSGENVVEIPVTFVVTSAPALTLSPSGAQSFNFTLLSGTTTGTLPITATSTSSTTNLPYTISVTSANAAGCTQPNWLTVTPGTGIAMAAPNGDVFNINANIAGCTAQTFVGDVHIHSATAAVQDQDIPVDLVINPAPAISTVPTSLNGYTFTSGASVPTNSQTLAVSTGSTAYTATFVPTTGGNWLTVGQVGGTVTVSLNAAVAGALAACPTLNVACYSGNVVITDVNTSNNPVSISITLDVNPTSVISAAPPSATFNWQSGSPVPATVPILLTVSGLPIGMTATVTQTSTSNGVSWLSASTVSLSTSSSTNAATVTIGVTPNGSMAPGTYTGNVAISSSNVSTVNIGVTLVVTNQPVISVNGAAVASQTAAYTLGNSTASTPICGAPINVTGTSNGLVINPVISTTSGGGTWILSPTFTGGTTPTQATICVTPGAVSPLAAGTYMGTVTMTSPNAISAVVNITLTINPQPVLTTPATATFNYTWNGVAPATQMLNVTGTENPVGLVLIQIPAGATGAAVNDCSWVSASLTGASAPTTIKTAVAVPLVKAPGSYTCTLTVNGTGATPSAPAVSSSTVITLNVAPLGFFAPEVSVGSGLDFETLSSGTLFGYFAYLQSNTIIYHIDLGYEGIANANDGGNGIYMYDFTSGHWWYTNPSTFPFLYDFTLQSWIYYFPLQGVSGRYTYNPRQFVNMTTGVFFTM